MRVQGFDIITESVVGEGVARVVDTVHVATGKHFVSKLIPLTTENPRTCYEQFFNEVHMLRHLNSTPNTHVVSIESSFVSGNTAVIVLEKMEGDLLDLILEERLSPFQKAHVFHQICVALQFCHQRGVAHLDIKPENILCDALGSSIRLADFGTSGEMQDGLVSAAHGTLQYNPPEVLMGGTSLRGEAVDVWSLGMLLHVLLTGTWPFNANDPEAIRSLLSKGKLTLSADLQKEEVKLLSHMLQVDPDRRASLETILASEYLRPFTAEDPPQPLARRTKPRSRLLHWLSKTNRVE